MPVDNRLTNESTPKSWRVRGRGPRTGSRLPAWWLILALMCCFTPCPCNGGDLYLHSNYVPPDELIKSGFTFAGQRVPLQRADVRDRVIEQLNYLLMDRRAGVMEWLDRLAVYGPVLRTALKQRNVPDDFVFLAAVLSELSPTAQSRTGGVGWWSLGSVKEKNPPVDCKWEAGASWDDRRDPEISTRIAAARFVWLKTKLQTNDWFLAAGAFIDGSEALEPLCKKAPGSPFWDIAAPLRAEILVPRSIALKIIDLHRDAYGVTIPKRDPLSYDILEGLRFKKEFPLRLIASWLKVDGRAVWEFNPGTAPASGVLGKTETEKDPGVFLRLPKGTAPKIRKLLVQEGYLDG